MVSGFLSCFELKSALAELRRATGGFEAVFTRNVTLDTIPPRIVEVIGVTDRVHVGAPFEIRVKVED